MTGLTGQRAEVGWQFWVRWVLASSVGCALGFAPFVYVTLAVRTFYEDRTFALALGITGLLTWGWLGLLQWLVLRPQLSSANRWVLATIVGGTAGSVAAWAVNVMVGPPAGRHTIAGDFIAIVLAGGAFGGILAILQLRILRQQVDRAGWWVLASIVGCALAFAIAEPISLLAFVFLQIHQPLSPLLFCLTLGAIAGVVNGSITGITLVRLLQHRVAIAPDA